MIINEGTANEIVMPIAFPGNEPGEVLARIFLREGEVIDLSLAQTRPQVGGEILGKDGMTHQIECE